MTMPNNTGDWVFKFVMALAIFLGSYWFNKMSDDLTELSKSHRVATERLARIEAMVGAQRDEIGRLHLVVESLRK